MEFKHNQTWKFFEKTLAARLPAREAWNTFLDLQEKAVPRPYWKKLRELDFEIEQADLIDWLEELATDEPIPAKVKACWIGLFKAAGKRNQEVPTIHIIGANSYDKKDMEWATDPSYLPERRYVQPSNLQQIDGIVRKAKKDYGFLDWILPLAYSAFTFDEIIRTGLNKKLFLGKKKKLYFAVGHDSGDYINLSDLA